jgi:hypothetical protein
MKFFKVDCNERFIMDILDHFPPSREPFFMLHSINGFSEKCFSKTNDLFSVGNKGNRLQYPVKKILVSSRLCEHPFAEKN